VQSNRFKKRLITSVLAVTIFAVMLGALFVPQVTAVFTTTITLIAPLDGPVGAELVVNGTIDTANGTYVLRWDETTNVTIGKATGFDVHTSFTVPQTAGDPFPGRPVPIELIDNTTGNIASTTFRLYTEYHIETAAPKPPFQLLEGQSTDIWVNVTGGMTNTVYVANITVKDPTNAVFWTTVSLANTTTTGYGAAKRTYPTDFGSEAHTNYTGTYHLAFNGTTSTASFTVGVTDKSEYARRYFSGGVEMTSQAVIRGSGFDAQTATIHIAYYDGTSLVPVEGYPKEENVTEGIVSHEWLIPEDAILSTYNVTLTSAVEKQVRDTQTFTLVEILVSCQAQNRYDNNSLAGVTIKAYRGALGAFYIDNRTTNGTGWVEFLLDHGHYSFGAYWRATEVGSLVVENVAGEATDYVLRKAFRIECNLAGVTMIAKDEEGPLPFVSVTLVNETTAPERIPPRQTDYTGILSTNAFTDTNYRIEARRYGHIFFNQSIGNLTKTLGNLTQPFPIGCPTYALFLYAADSKGVPIQNAPVKVVEWSSGRVVGEGTTSQWGSIRLNCTFGRYKARVYNPDQTIILNETVVDVVQNSFYLAIHCRIVDLDLSVKATDHFGTPIPNAMASLEREGGEILNLTTGPDGIACRTGVLGGNCRISIYVAGRLCEVRSLHLDESGEILFRVSDIVVVGGYPLASSQLITGTSLVAMILAFCAIIQIHRRRSKNS